MANILSFDGFLNEAKQAGILYHYTHVDSMYDILTNGMLKKAKNTNAISLTRDKYFHLVSRDVPTYCRFVLDGDLLSTKYIIFPYDDGMDKNHWKGHPERAKFANEFEERLVSKKPVDDIIKYILRVEINKQMLEHLKKTNSLIGRVYTHTNKELYPSYIEKIETICLEKNIEFGYF